SLRVAPHPGSGQLMGCLAAPFKFAGCLGLLAALFIGWMYRDRLTSEARRVFGSFGGTEAPASAGRPGSRALVTAHAKIDSLNGWRADSVVLSASEVASMIGSGLDPSLRSQLDSLQVELEDGSITVKARLATARLPKELIGPLSMALKPTEPIQAAGPLTVVAPRQAEWALRSFSIRGFPLPHDAVPQLVSKALGDPSRKTVPVRIPAGIREIHLRPTGANLVVKVTASGGEALTVYPDFRPHLVFLDVKMAGLDGLETLTRLRSLDPNSQVVMISGHGTIATAVEATQRGAFDFLEKPLDTDRLLVTVRNALAQAKLMDENTRLREESESRFRMVGDSPALQEVRELIAKVGPTSARVLITGENGTGKELVARSLHEVSPRQGGAFIEVNCAAIPSELIESELFGHMKGSFTGAFADRAGKFEQADG